MTATTKLSAKGQVVIPAGVRRELGLKPGQKLQVRKAGDGVMLTPIQEKSGRSTDELIAELRKIYTHKGPPASLEDMDRAIDRMFAERGRADF
ncbi:MAG TPA: AbrB/MazE/SpoVT family DNA-binding domain-containing protein [Allosphingosinicella sp.]|nr:AbrB/MazE/SpoVT family DNA-binding domain-containing protein [Allosphingosinicella sp.]